MKTKIPFPKEDKRDLNEYNIRVPKWLGEHLKKTADDRNMTIGEILVEFLKFRGQK